MISACRGVLKEDPRLVGSRRSERQRLAPIELDDLLGDLKGGESERSTGVVPTSY